MRPTTKVKVWCDECEAEVMACIVSDFEPGVPMSGGDEVQVECQACGGEFWTEVPDPR